MKIVITRKRSAVALTLVLSLCIAVVSYFVERSEAQNRRGGSLAPTDGAVVNLLDENSAKIKFVSGSNRPTESQIPVSDMSGVTPLTLASGDLNGDGFPDLICGYAVADGGLLVVYYGDEHAFAPTDPSDVQAALQNQFRNPFGNSTTIRLENAPDFLFTGDFDRDGQRDILSASKGGLSLDLQLSTEAGFTSRTVASPGQLTAVAVSEAYTPDGFADVYAGIVGGNLLAFDKSTSVLEQRPDVYSLPGSADSIALGRFDSNTAVDFAVVVSGRVYVVHGGKNSRTESVDLPFHVNAVAAGDFIWDRNSRMEIAVASGDGSTSIVSRGELDTRPLEAEELEGRRQLISDIRDGKRSESSLFGAAASDQLSWRIAEQTSAKAGISHGGSPTLIPILASGQQSVDLLAINSDEGNLSISYRTDALTADRASVRRESFSFASGPEPVAALPMRLNLHARPSMVVLRKGATEPEFLFVAPEAVFVVSKTADTLDGTCNADCSLREAVTAANGAAGLDTIQFSAALNGLPIQLTRAGDDNTNVNGDLDVNSDITFVGNGTVNTLIQGSSSSTFTGNMGDKAIGINQDGLLTAQSVSIQDLTVRFTRNDINVNGAFTQTGGAMDIFLTGTGAMPGPTTALTNVTFSNNASLHSRGGALNIDSGSLVAPTSNVFRGTVNITGSTFADNDTLTTTFGDDSPVGGAINIFADIQNVTISSSSITGNQTAAIDTGTGGGLNIRQSFGGTVTINGNTNISNNISGSDGGGMLTAFNQTVNMTGGTINGNTAQGTGDSAAGGGFFNGSNVGFSTTLTSVAITNNIATAGANGTGGGVADGANSPINLTSCTITGNSADNGGGLAVVSAGGGQTMTVTSSGTFSGNTATNGSAAQVSAGILAFSLVNTVSGNIDVATSATAALTANTGSTMNLTGNLTMSNGVITSNNSTFGITGSYSQSGGTFNGNTSTYNISAGSTLSGGIFNAGGNYNVTGTFTQSGGTYNGGGTMSITGAGNFTKTNGSFGGGAGTINLIGNFSHTGGTFAGGTGTFNFNGSGAQSVSASTAIVFNNLSDANVTQPLTFNNSINVNGTLTANGAATILNPVAAAVIGGSGTLTGTGTVRVTRATGTNDFLTQYTITNKTLTGLLVDYVGPGAQGISGTTYTNVRLNNASGGTLSAPATVNGTLTLAAGAFNVGTSTLTLNNVITLAGASLTSSSTGTVIYNLGSNGQQVVAGTYGNLTFSNFNKILPATGTVFIAGTFTPGTAVGHTITGSTVQYNGTVLQTLPPSFVTYNNLTLNNAAGVTGFAGLTVQGLLRVQLGTFTSSSSTYNNVQIDSSTTMAGTNATTINVSGNWTNNGTFTANGNSVNFNGAAPQAIGGSSATTFNNLSINNATGINLNTAATVNGAFTLQSGELTTGANTLTIGTTGTVNRISGYVVGTVTKNFAGATPAFLIPVGTAGAYSPLNVTVVSGAGSLTTLANVGTPPIVPVPLDATRTLQRYWTLSGSGITSNITFNYLDGDVPPAPNDENIWNVIRVTGNIAVRYPPTLPYVTMDPTNNRFTMSGLTTYSHWTAGEPLAPTAANAEVAGRVRDADGRSVSKAQVVMQGPEGTVLRAVTNPFGYYRFSNVPSGQSYLVSVEHKGFQFQTRTINVTDDLSDLDFIAEAERKMP